MNRFAPRALPRAQALEAAPRLRTTSRHTFNSASNFAFATTCARWLRKSDLTRALKADLLGARRPRRKSSRSRSRSCFLNHPQKLSMGLRSGDLLGMWTSRMFPLA